MGVKSNDGIIHLDQFLPYKVILLADRLSRRIAALVKDHGDLTLSEWRVIAAVADRPGRTANEVVAITPMDKGVVSRSAKALIDRELVRREASDADGRIAHLYLTSSGQAQYDAIAARILALEAQFSGMLTDEERKILRDALDRLLDATQLR